jgi:magnesium-transporting ATPase (P-type)
MNDGTSAPTIAGLTTAEVADRVARGLVNRVQRSDTADYWAIVRRNLLTVFNGFVVPAAIALFILKDYRGAVAVSTLATINTLLGLVQEVRAKWHLDHLAILTETRTHVLRDGRPTEIPTGDVVEGDAVLLGAGEPIIADGTVLESRYLEVDEALLTGESDPVPRRAGDKLLSGSFAVAGEGSYRADQVGAASFAQQTTAEARAYRLTASPLQKGIDRIILALTCLAVFLSAFYGLLFLVRPYGLTELVQRIAATITSMVPQGLVLMSTLAFILGAVRMSARGAVVQRLSAVESMAAVEVLCMDKTGTLTTNRLRLEQLRVVGAEPEEGVRQRLRWFLAGSLDRTNKSLAALRVSLGEADAVVLDQLPFKSQNRYSAIRVRAGGREYVLALGAFEALEPFIEGASSVRAAFDELLRTGLRILVFSEAITTDRTTFEGSLRAFQLRPLALLALSDEVRPEAIHVLELLAAQGITFKIVSGDNPETVRATVAPLTEKAIAPALKALAEQPVVTGADLEKALEPGDLIRRHGVFGRVAPRQKVEIVRTLQAQGRYVAMIGDGINDVLPIKNAHLGIAMGDGSRANKTVSGLVLETNNFGLLPQTLEEGRTIIRNLRRAAKLFLVKNAFTLVLIVGALGLFNLPFPFKPQQVTLLNLLTIGIPAFLITLSREQSAAPSRPGFFREVAGFAARTGLVIGAAGLAAMLLSRQIWRSDVPTQRTMLLSVLILLGVTTLLRALTDGEVRPLSGDRRFRWLAAGIVPVYLVAMYWPPSAWYHELTPLDIGQWALVFAIAAAAYGLLVLSDGRRLRGT